LLRSLVSAWGTNVLMNRQLAREALDAQRLLLADVLFESVGEAEPLSRWLTRMTTGFIQHALPADSTYDDVRGQLRRLIEASTEGALRTATIRSFGRQRGDRQVLNLVTLHSAKGLEFDSVVLLGLEEGVLPRWDAKTRDALTEARRLFYVGLTRARREVHMTYSGFTINGKGQRFDNGPSRFIAELQRRLRAAT
jgi:DNA helicase II / ATP-dependent DNA helicase PcrA